MNDIKVLTALLVAVLVGGCTSQGPQPSGIEQAIPAISVVNALSRAGFACAGPVNNPPPETLVRWTCAQTLNDLDVSVIVESQPPLLFDAIVEASGGQGDPPRLAALRQVLRLSTVAGSQEPRFDQWLAQNDPSVTTAAFGRATAKIDSIPGSLVLTFAP